MANLTPEMLARILASQGSEFYGDGRNYMGNNGSGWAPGSGGYSGQDGYHASAPTEIRGYDWAPGQYSDNFELNGTQYDKFDPATGQNTGQGTFSGLRKNSAMDTIAPFAMAALPFALSMFPSLGAAASFGTNPVTGAAGGGAGAAGGAGYGIVGGATEPAAAGGLGGGAAGGSGAFLGEGVASGVPAWDAAATGAGLSLSGAGTGLLGGASKWLGPAATLLGAAAGAKPQKASETSVKSMDPRMDALFYGDLAPRVQGLLQKQMAPGAMQGFTDMQSVGRGLLNAPVAGNGFNRFFPGK